MSKFVRVTDVNDKEMHLNLKNVVALTLLSPGRTVVTLSSGETFEVKEEPRTIVKG